MRESAQSPEESADIDQPEKPARSSVDPVKSVGEVVPGKMLRSAILLAVAIHLFALSISFLALIEPSQTHRDLLDWFSPLLRTTHFAADGRNFYLAHATSDEQVHRLQVADASDPTTSAFVFDVATRWVTVQPSGKLGTTDDSSVIPGFASSDRYQRWMLTAGALSEASQPSLAAMMLAPMLPAQEKIDAVRIVRLPTQLTTAADDAAPPVYVARAVKDGEQPLRLIAIESPRLTTQSRTGRTVGSARQDPGQDNDDSSSGEDD